MNSATNTQASEAVRWHVIGFREAVYQPAPGEPYRAAGCCDKCGQGIRYVVTVKSTTGAVMNVGRDCAVTLEGGPELAAIRRAEREYAIQQYLASPEYQERLAKERARNAEQAERRALAETVHALALFGLRAIQASPNCSTWEKDHAKAIESRIVAGHAWDVEDMDDKQAWTIATAAVKAALPPADHYVGRAGEKVEVVAFFESCIGIDTAYGRNWIHKLRTTDGALLVWFSKSTELNRDDLGSWFRIRASVKAHDAYRGEMQTKILRVKAEEV